MTDWTAAAMPIDSAMGFADRSPDGNTHSLGAILAPAITEAVSASSNALRQAGKRMERSRSMSGYCDPSPGNRNTVRPGAGHMPVPMYMPLV